MIRASASLALGALLCGAPLSAQAAHPAPPLRTLTDLARYVGSYPCQNGLLRSPVLLDALKKTLQQDYEAYREHMAESGCGPIERRGPYIFLDVSQLHVGGYGSMILVRQADEKTFVYWLKSTVAERDVGIYGSRPVPTDALDLFAKEGNVGWGHVACFAVVQGDIAIDTTRRANQDTGECISP